MTAVYRVGSFCDVSEYRSTDRETVSWCSVHLWKWTRRTHTCCYTLWLKVIGIQPRTLCFIMGPMQQYSTTMMICRSILLWKRAERLSWRDYSHLSILSQRYSGVETMLALPNTLYSKCDRCQTQCDIANVCCVICTMFLISKCATDQCRCTSLVSGLLRDM